MKLPEASMTKTCLESREPWMVVFILTKVVESASDKGASGRAAHQRSTCWFLRGLLAPRRAPYRA